MLNHLFRFITISTEHWAVSSHSWESSHLTERFLVGCFWYLIFFCFYSNPFSTNVFFACGVSGFPLALQISHRGWKESQLAESCLASSVGRWDLVKPTKQFLCCTSLTFLLSKDDLMSLSTKTFSPSTYAIKFIYLFMRRISLFQWFHW